MGVDEARLVIHVGAVPTASWRLQRTLSTHRDALQAQGLGFLDTDTLAECIGSGDPLLADPAPLARALDAAAQHHEAVLVSHEGIVGDPFAGSAGLVGGAAPILEALEHATRGRPRLLVLSLCPQDEFLTATYSRLVTLRRTSEPFSAWASAVDLADLSWQPLADRLTATFGADAVRLVGYRDIERDHAAFVHTVLDLAGVTLPASAIEAATPPPGLSGKGLALLLAAIPFMASAGEWDAMRGFVGRTFSRLEYPPPRLLSEEQRADLQARYGAEYASLTDRIDVLPEFSS
jgi:hypothetical protein